MTVVDAFLGLLISMLANQGTEAVEGRRRRFQQSQLDWEQANQQTRSLREQVLLAVTAAAKEWPAGSEADAVRMALCDEAMSGAFSDWLLAWQPEERNAHAGR